MDADSRAKIRGGRKPKPVEFQALKRPREPRFWAWTCDANEADGGWRQVTKDEAVFLVVLEMIESGEVEAKSDRDREAIAEVFRKRAGVAVSYPQLAAVLGVSKQRAYQLTDSAIRKLQRAAGLNLIKATEKTRQRIDPAKALKEYAA